MAKTLKETPVTTANARAKLTRGLYWKGIDPEVHLGYRKGQCGGAPGRFVCSRSRYNRPQFI